MKHVNTAEFCKTTYSNHPWDDSGDDFDEIQMKLDIADFVAALLKNDYQVRIYSDGLTVAVEYDFRDQSLAGNNLVWLSPAEYVESYEPETCYDCEPESEVK